MEEIRGWFSGRLPDEWFEGAPEVSIDREEIVVVGRLADEAESRFGRKVAWGASCGETTQVFTNLSVPVMTRLRQSERQVLDTLVEAGVARSRSDALAWSVRLVGQHQREWIDELRQALVAVEAARAGGPTP